jgi:urea carboxylase
VHALPRYSLAGDEYIFVEMSFDMSLEVCFKVQAICKEMNEEGIEGVIEAYPGNNTYLVHYNPDRIETWRLLEILQGKEKKAGSLAAFESNLVEIPVLYDDPWTRDCAKAFAAGHPDPSMTNLEFVAKINGLSVPDFIRAHSSSQYLVSMERFLPGSCCLIQMVSRERTLSCPKYLVPRTWSPVRSLVIGGIITSISPYRSPGGYQLLGRSALPVYDPEEKLKGYRDGILIRCGDRVKLTAVNLKEYTAIRESVKSGKYTIHMIRQRFDPSMYLKYPDDYLKTLNAGLS